MVKMAIETETITTVILIMIGAGVMIVIALFLLPSGFEQIPGLCQFAPSICPGTVYAGEGGIDDFFVTKQLGKSVKITAFLTVSDGELPYHYFYHNASGEDKQKITGFAPKHGKYEFVYELPDFEPRTVGLVVPSDENEDMEVDARRSEFVDLKSGMDSTSFFDFVRLNDAINFLVNGEEESRIFINYDLNKDLILVGFNKGDVVEVCARQQRILMPEECEETSCLCLCKKEKDPCHSGKRLCFGFEDVDYFIGEQKILHWGGGFTHPQYGPTYYLVLYGDCGSPTWAEVNRDLILSKTQENGETFVKIHSNV